MQLLIRIFACCSKFQLCYSRSRSFFYLQSLLRTKPSHIIYKVVSYLLKIFVQLNFKHILFFLRIEIIKKLRIGVRSNHFLRIIFNWSKRVKGNFPQLSPRIPYFIIFICNQNFMRILNNLRLIFFGALKPYDILFPHIQKILCQKLFVLSMRLWNLYRNLLQNKCITKCNFTKCFVKFQIIILKYIKTTLFISIRLSIILVHIKIFWNQKFHELLMQKLDVHRRNQLSFLDILKSLFIQIKTIANVGRESFDR